jgi:heptosyltransferase-1
MGDVLHTLPALTDAVQAFPGIRFDWVVEEGFAQIPSWHEAVDRVIPVAIRRWRKAWFSAPVKAERQAFRDAVRAQNMTRLSTPRVWSKAPRWSPGWRAA